MSVNIQYTGGNEVPGFSKDMIEKAFGERFRGREGHVKLHFKQLKDHNKGAPHVLIHANGQIEKKKLIAESDGFGMATTMHELLDRLEIQLKKQIHA